MNANTPHDANAVALDVDSTIDRALSTLRDAQPRSGLNGRILATLEHRATEPGGLPFRNVKRWGIARSSARENLSWTAHFALWTATAAAIIAIASLLILHHHAAPAKFAHSSQAASVNPTNAVILSERSESKNPETARRTSNSEPFSTTNLAQTTQTVSSRPDLIGRHPERSAIARSRRTPVFETCSDHHDTGCPIHDDNVVMSGSTTTPTDAQLLADLHAPSHPAPPLPLTAEEKLFLRMLRYGNATQIAELNPILRAKQAADETEAFKAFFPDPPPLDQSNGDNE